jgi:hypothetical protein
VADDPLNLDEPGEWAGLWWLPEEPENQIPGVLRYLPDGKLELSLIGAFEERLMTTTSPGVVLSLDPPVVVWVVARRNARMPF